MLLLNFYIELWLLLVHIFLQFDDNKKDEVNLHLVKSAKELTEKFLNIDNCPTETNFFIDKDRIKKVKDNLNNNSYKIVIGAGSSGPTTRWGANNYADLINKLNELDDYFFFILCGPNEK